MDLGLKGKKGIVCAASKGLGRACATALAREGERFEIDILGDLRSATVRLEALHDPQGLRLRG